ncbi:diguanylate cyclase [Maledivibacter halophilus]|uniref:Stage 0 sporulation protein A homolog n=1 Tax=Maledivibacter halophilus TaxID=36842 RepID=A0A1T5JDE0_9FIRM|nr:diguanylate cyclase [Maledivibacter halophilus]SKC49364.1 diguanylate cyclase (GGDEF) domain-containing protein [Maledivibacter halophilus]
MEIRQSLIHRLIMKKDEQFSNLIQYCLYGKNKNLNNVESFLRTLNKFSKVLDFKSLVNISNELKECLILYKNSSNKDKNLLFKILELYSDIYSEVEKLDTELFDISIDDENNSEGSKYSNLVHKGNILVVDDDVMVLDLLEKIFSKRGYDIILCSNPFHVIKIIKENRIDLAILDLVLPETDGCDVIELIRKIDSRLPIIILSGSTDTENKIRAFRIGADDYIAKPFEEKELVARVERTITRHMNFKISSIEDGLTGAYVKSYFWRKMKEINKTYRRNQKIFSLAFIDMDCFKNINDTYGHLIGDEVLKCFVWTLRSSLRFTDYVFRFGGDEFVILFPETNEEQAYNILERFRNSIDYDKCMKSNAGIVCEGAFSAGITEVKNVYDKIEDIIKRADIALYKAKMQGKNKTCIYETPSALMENNSL